MQSKTEYNQYVEDLLGSLREAQIRGQNIDPEFCVTGLEANRPETYRVREYAIKSLKISAKTFDSALRRESLSHALDCDPSDLPSIASEFIVFMVKRMNVSVQYNGLLNKREMPYVLDEIGNRLPIPANLWDNHEFKTMIATKFHCSIPFSDFCLEVRTFAVDHGLPWKASELNDACQKWYRGATQDRVYEIAATIDYTDSLTTRQAGQAALKRLAETCFDTWVVDADFIVAVFNKFIWQVKRKIRGLEITDHLMPVIIGIQGNGKSTLIRHMLTPISELWVPSDFKQITDERNTMLWKNYALFLDEMGWASKSDIDTVKNTITAEFMNRRIMHSTDYNVVRQNATFIGASNMLELADLIRDTSGTRRFITLHMIDQPNREVVNSMNWSEVWRSVDETASDPMLSHRATLRAVQAEDRTLTPVEEWLASLTSLSGTHSTTHLHDKFLEYERERFPANRGMSIQAFGREMKARAKMAGSRFEVEINSRSGQATYRWRNPPAKMI